MSPVSVVIDGRVRTLGPKIGRGGEGEVFLLTDEKGIVVKIYTVADLAARAEKVRAIIDAGLAKSTPLVAFPTASVTTAQGAFVGFAMRLIDGHKPLHELYAPGSRRVQFPQADYRFLVRAAANVARAVAAVHRSGCVIGDINHSGILVSPKAVVALIDADSFQIAGRDGRRYLCKVGVPEYTPPELQGQTFSQTTRLPNHDAFGLAVVVFQLLFMGRHPFVGTVRRGDIPQLHENIARRRYVYTDKRNVGMDQPPGTPSIQDFSPSISKAFDAAFLEDKRPSAEDWVRLLDELEASLAKCQDNPLHYLPRDASECPWCEMERQLGTILFLPYVPAAALANGTDPGAMQFDLAQVWNKIEAVRASVAAEFLPKLPASNVQPSESARAAMAGSESWSGGAMAMMLVAILGVFAAPQAFLIWGFIFLAALANLRSKKEFDPAPFKAEYVSSMQRYQEELEAWRNRSGAGGFFNLYQELAVARNDYESIKRAVTQQVNSAGERSRSAQLEGYLAMFPVEHANLPGIGPATLATLASFGIDTAANVRDGWIQKVPGVGNKLAERLLDWRQRLQSQFVYRTETSAEHRNAAAQANAAAELRLAPLRAKLVVGPQNLTLIVARTRTAAGLEDALVSRAAQRKDQALCDLNFLGISLPSVPVTTSKSNSSAAAAAPVPRPSPVSPIAPPPPPPPSQAHRPSSSILPCPRCGSKMVQRLAKRGRYAGSYFWGCSRFPTCKGLRNM